MKGEGIGMSVREEEVPRVSGFACTCGDVTHDVVLNLDAEGRVRMVYIPVCCRVEVDQIEAFFERRLSNGKPAGRRWSTIPGWQFELFHWLMKLDWIPSFLRRASLEEVEFDLEASLQPEDADRLEALFGEAGLSGWERDDGRGLGEPRTTGLNRVWKVAVKTLPRSVYREFLFAGSVSGHLLLDFRSPGDPFADILWN
jgi:hypothetical protein